MVADSWSRQCLVPRAYGVERSADGPYYHHSVQSVSRLTRDTSITMRLSAVSILLVLGPLAANAQFFNAIRNLFAPVTNLFNGGRFQDDGTVAPQATGKEELFPSDCGRDTNLGTGKLCFPDGLLCKDSEYCYPPPVTRCPHPGDH